MSNKSAPKKSAPKKSAPEEELDIDLEESEESEDVAEEETQPEPETKPAAKKAAVKSDVVFVNKEKLARAKDIALLVSGKRSPRDAGELERQQHYTGLLSDRGVKPSDATAVQALYEILGGLVRTPQEQAQAEAAAVAASKKHKRRKIEDAGPE